MTVAQGLVLRYQGGCCAKFTIMATRSHMSIVASIRLNKNFTIGTSIFLKTFRAVSCWFPALPLYLSSML